MFRYATNLQTEKIEAQARARFQKTDANRERQISARPKAGKRPEEIDRLNDGETHFPKR